MIATIVTLVTPMTTGNTIANIRPTRSAREAEIVGDAEALDLLRLADEGADDADTGDLFSQHAVHGVDPLLHCAESGDHAIDRDRHEHTEDRDGDGEDPPMPGRPGCP